MQLEHLVRQANLFYRLASEKSLDTILKELSALDTFKARVDYAEKHLKHLSSGSSRVIYTTPDNEVLKLAKNERGIAQNKVESSPKIKSKYINPTLKSDPNGVWKISPYCDKITEKEFEQMTGVSFEDFGDALRYGLRNISSNHDVEKPATFDKSSKLEMYKEIVDTAQELNVLPGDLVRPSSWGQCDSHPVILDFALTRSIYNRFYDSNRDDS